VSVPKPATIAELRASGHVRETVKHELRRNLLARIRSGQELFPGIVGYDETVIPQISNAIISGHDMILLGERGRPRAASCAR
jgi:magnesium chelatase subunit I